MPEPQTPAPLHRLTLDVCVARSPELDAHAVLQAIRALEAGDREAAMHGYRDALAIRFVHPDSWSNLAALAIALDDVAGARRHAARALELARDHADALVNLGVACWHAGLRREGAQAMAQALSQAPMREAAALNYSLMLQATGQLERAHAVIDEAAHRAPDSLRVREAAASIARLWGRHDRTRLHALAAIRALQPGLRPSPMAGPESDDPSPAQGDDAMHAAMTDTCNRLERGQLAYTLIGGLVLGIVRQGRPFTGDKDIDIALDDALDRDAVAAVFVDGFTPVRVAAAHARDARRWCMGYVHDATGIGVDLFFAIRRGREVRQGLGWPDDLMYDYPAWETGRLRWVDRDWPVPAPLEDYLASNYGADWRSPWREVGDGRRFDKRWFDTQVSCPGLVEESIPRAINLVLLRLLSALRQGQWEKALALCDQVLVHGPIIEVEAVRDHLLAAGIR